MASGITIWANPAVTARSKTNNDNRSDSLDKGVQPWLIDIEAHTLTDPNNNGRGLRPQAFSVLQLLFENRGKTVSKDTLLDSVWNRSTASQDSLVKAIGDVRKALDDKNHTIIITVPKRGYQLAMDANLHASPADIQNTQAVKKPVKNLRYPFFSGGPKYFWPFLILGMALLSWFIAVKRTATGPLFEQRIAVMRFASNDDPLLAEGISEDLITELARHQDLHVVSRFSSFSLTGKNLNAKKISHELNAKYIVNGTLRTENNKLLLAMTVYDAGEDRIIRSFTKPISATSLDESRSQVVHELSANIQGGKTASERTAVIEKQTSSLDPYIVSLLTVVRKHRFNQDDYRLARTEAKHVLKSNDSYAPLLIALAFLDYVDAVNQISGDVGLQDLDSILSMVNRALSENSDIPMGWHVSSIVLSSMQRQTEALQSALRAFELAPNDPETLLFLSGAYLINGKAGQSKKYLDLARAGFPVVPSYFQLFNARAHWGLDNFEKSISAADDCLAKSPYFLQCRVQKIISLYELGDKEQAAQETSKLRAQLPTIDNAVFVGVFNDANNFAQRRLDAARFVLSD